jgi:hypothetical protein
MSSGTDKQARVEAMLGELAELGLMVAKELAIRLRESEDAAETVALAGAFQKMSRTVRLTLALDAKLVRDIARDAAAVMKAAQEAETEAVARAERAEGQRRTEEALRQGRGAPEGPVAMRKARVVSLVKRLLWNESEGEAETYEILTEELDARLDEAARHPGFLDLPIETLARRILADFGARPPSRSASASRQARHRRRPETSNRPTPANCPFSPCVIPAPSRPVPGSR